jgi:hypothetical protein
MAFTLWRSREQNQTKSPADRGKHDAGPQPRREGNGGASLDLEDLEQELKEMQLSPEVNELVRVVALRLIDDALKNIARRAGMLEDRR